MRRAEIIRGRLLGGGLVAIVIALLLALSVGSAAAQIDVSGRWHLMMFDNTFGLPFERALTLAQSGTTLTVSGPPGAPYSGGTIDPLTGSLHLDGQGSCFNFLTGETVTFPWRIDAVAAADGASFSGTFEESIQPTRSCFLVGGPVEAVRLAETCGNGNVDAGEACDAGLLGSHCCTEFCTARPAGSFCPSNGGACTASSACDGAGTCVHTPKAAGELCRFATDPCDTPELCDGTAFTCPPPSTPTEPDVDGDGVLDPCDDCVGQPIEEPRLRLGRFGVGPVRDSVVLHARVRFPTGATLPDPRTTWKLVELRDATGAFILYAQIPGGPFDPETRQGWSLKRQRWTFRTAEPIVGFVSRMTIAPARDDPDAWDVRVKTPRASLTDAVPVQPLALKLILDGLGPSNRCGQRVLGLPGDPSLRCSAPSSRGFITCR